MKLYTCTVELTVMFDVHAENNDHAFEVARARAEVLEDDVLEIFVFEILEEEE